MSGDMNGASDPLLESTFLTAGMPCRNRVAMAAMTHYSAPEDGSVGEAELAYIERRSSGPGVVFTACVATAPQGKAYDGEPAAHDDRFLPGLTAWADTIKRGGARAILQLHHGGGVCPPRLVPNGDIVSPSGVPTPGRSEATPRELSDAEIEAVIEGFRTATIRGIKTGFDGVEIHGGYGYLPQQFLSPYTNRREDRWGGTREKRHAFCLALLKAAQEAARDHADRPFAVGYRFTFREQPSFGLRAVDERPRGGLGGRTLDLLADERRGDDEGQAASAKSGIGGQGRPMTDHFLTTDERGARIDERQMLFAGTAQARERRPPSVRQAAEVVGPEESIDSDPDQVTRGFGVDGEVASHATLLSRQSLLPG